ncbi:type 1 glutamine amidotransferase domain-containing protein [Verrucomicrobia bacterium LW23]|nr:type 1 glutamine amidotransferase domain-containing protein [Verrucomicrobia bacterium LW23]
MVVVAGTYVAHAAEAAKGTPAGGDKKKAVLFILTNAATMGSTGKPTGAYLSEITHPYYEFKRAGLEIVFASPKGGVVPLTGIEDARDAESLQFLKDAQLMEALKTTRPLADVKAADYAAIFFPGGHGTMFDLPDSQVVADFTGKFYDAGGVVSAVCHGPAGLVNVKLANGKYLVEGKHVSCFTDSEERAVKLDKAMPFLLESKLEERGAIIAKADNFKMHVVVSERLVTGQNPASAKDVAKEVLLLLKKK